MNAHTTQNKKGFTIIEVVLVLAIAALIFLMVFIALPALQRNQRDTARKTVMGKIASSITTYQSNKRGLNPTNGAALAGYIDGTVSGNDSTMQNGEYTIKVSGYGTGANQETGTGQASTTVVQVLTGAKCTGSGDSSEDGTPRQAAVIIQLENADAFICQDV